MLPQPRLTISAPMAANSRGFPPGAAVLVDGKRRAVVRQYFPRGSTTFAFPHYLLSEGAWRPEYHTWEGEVFSVAAARVGVRKH